MKAICKFVFALFLLATVSSVSAQDYYYSNRLKPIQLGDSVLVAVGWNATPNVERIHFDDLIQPTKEDIQKRRFAFFIYPKATRIVNAISIQGGKRIDLLDPNKPSKLYTNLFTIKVLDKDGKEIRDSLSDKSNVPIRVRRVPIASPEEKPNWENTAVRLHAPAELIEYLDKKYGKEDKK
jgi:hypothetical protein